jgi:hypothetical protein
VQIKTAVFLETPNKGIRSGNAILLSVVDCVID